MKQFLKRLSSYLNFTAGHPVSGQVIPYWRDSMLAEGLLNCMQLLAIVSTDPWIIINSSKFQNPENRIPRSSLQSCQLSECQSGHRVTAKPCGRETSCCHCPSEADQCSHCLVYFTLGREIVMTGVERVA